MADEAQCSSDTGSNKRKYEEQTALSAPLPAWVTASTSGLISSTSSLYNSLRLPPPLWENLGPPPTAYVHGVTALASAGDFAVGKHTMSTLSAIPVSYNYGQGTSKKIDIPSGRVGVIIGKAGETIKSLELQSGAKIQVAHDMDAAPNSLTRPVELMGTPEQIAKAEQLINNVLSVAEAGGPGVISKRVTGQTGSSQFVMKIPDNMVGLVIGKGGETIKNMQARTGARIQVVPLHPPPGAPATDRNLYIDGTSEQIEAAKLLVDEVIRKGFERAVMGSSFGFIQRSTSMRLVEQMDEIKIKEPGMLTQLMNFVNEFDRYSAVSTPFYQTVSFKQPSATESGPDDYLRSGNPTRDALESLLAKLDRADRAFCFTSGMAAMAAVTRLVSNGEQIVAGDDLHGGSERLLVQVNQKPGVVVKRVNTSDLHEVASAVGPSTKLVWLESPTNPLQKISDIQKIAEMAHAHGALVLVDNCTMSPVLSQPLELGADIVMNSATKFISGHVDVTAGVLAVKGESLAKQIYFLHDLEGSSLAPIYSWICWLSIKTMALRIEKQQENAQKIAEFLSSHPRVKKAYYAGLPDHPGHDLHYKQAKGAGSLLSFVTGSVALSRHIVETTKYFSKTVGFGSANSLISMPCFMSHKSIPASVREARGLAEDLIRISVGIEDVTDLISDLDTALRTGPS